MIIEPLGAFLTGYDPAPGPGRSLLGNLDVIIRETGSRRAAGRYLGIAESTLRGWQAGVSPRRDPRPIGTAARDLTLGQTFQDAFDGTTELTITGIFQGSGEDSRPRTINPGRTIPRWLMRRILNLWHGGRDDRAEDMLENAINSYYAPLHVRRVDNLRFV